MGSAALPPAKNAKPKSLETLNALEAQLAAAMTDKDRCDALGAIAWELRMLEPERSETLSKEAMALAQSLGYTHGAAQAELTLGLAAFRRADYEDARAVWQSALDHFGASDDSGGVARALDNIGSAYDALGDYAEALDYHERSLRIRRAIGDRDGEAACLNNLGNTYYVLGDFARSLEFHLASLSIARTDSESYGEAVSLANIGNLYYIMRDYDRARLYYEKSLDLRRAIGYQYGEAAALNNLANLALDLGDREKALRLLEQSLELRRAIGYRHGEALSLANLGSVYEALGDHPKALACFEDALRLHRESGDKMGETECLLLIGKRYTALRQPDTALPTLESALRLAESLGAKVKRYEAHLALAEVMELTGNSAAAYQHHKQFHRLKEEVFGEDSEKKLRNLRTIHQVEQTKKEAELSRVQAEAYRLKTVELSKANETLREVNRLKTELLSIAAHDLKNPLQTMMGFASLIEEEPTHAQHAADYAALIREASERMLHLIVNLLESAAAELGKMSIAKTRTDIAELAAAAAEQNRVQAERKEQTLLLIAAPECVASVDADRMRDVFDNLISNAVKYSPRGKTIWIEVRKEGIDFSSDAPISNLTAHPSPVIRISVKDEGQGLTENDKVRLFGAFQRLSARPTGGESATGLGLAIVKQLVELHGGKVWAESDGQGKGSTFFIELPSA